MKDRRNGDWNGTIRGPVGSGDEGQCAIQLTDHVITHSSPVNVIVNVIRFRFLLQDK